MEAKRLLFYVLTPLIPSLKNIHSSKLKGAIDVTFSLAFISNFFTSSITLFHVLILHKHARESESEKERGGGEKQRERSSSNSN